MSIKVGGVCKRRERERAFMSTFPPMGTQPLASCGAEYLQVKDSFLNPEKCVL